MCRVVQFARQRRAEKRQGEAHSRRRGMKFHPEARFDLAGIWEFIRADNLGAADR
jgi:hypothetical protein